MLLGYSHAVDERRSESLPTLSTQNSMLTDKHVHMRDRLDDDELTIPLYFFLYLHKRRL